MNMKRLGMLRSLIVAALTAVLASCGGTSTFQFNSNNGQGTVAVIGSDAPLASVLSFRVTITGITASDGTNTVNLLTTAQDVDFARLSGLKTLLDFNSVAAGNYTKVTVMLANPMIKFLDVTKIPPAINSKTGTLLSSSVIVPLNPALMVTDKGMAALLFDFNLRKSLEVDATGMITGNVTPTLSMKAISPDAPEADIDELRGGVVSVDAVNNSFVMQLPNGRTLTVVTDSNTEFEEGEGLGKFDTNTIVQVSGQLDRATLTLHAEEVRAVSMDRFFVGGLVTDVRPATGQANMVDVFVRDELPAVQSFLPGSIGTFAFNGNEQFFIERLRLPLALFLFNRSTLVRGQSITLGGKLNTTPPDLRRVTLHHQAVAGSWIPGSTVSQGGNQGTFQINADGLVGVTFNGPLTVLTSGQTRFTGGISGLGDLTGTKPIPLRIVGLVLKDPVSAGPDIVARRVELMD
jgi:hypothetical protein